MSSVRQFTEIGCQHKDAAQDPPNGSRRVMFFLWLTRQDDYDIWLGTGIIQPGVAGRRHNGTANHLYLDGHARGLRWPEAVVDMYPDQKVFTQNGSFP